MSAVRVLGLDIATVTGFAFDAPGGARPIVGSWRAPSHSGSNFGPAFTGGVRCTEIGVSTVKAQFAGHGRADKAAMMARCRQLGWEVRNDHEADAAGLWFYAKSSVDKTFRVEAGTPLFARAAE